MNHKIIELKRMLWAPLLIIVLFGSAAKYFISKAMLGNSALIYKSVHITPGMAVYIYWSMFLISLLFVLLGCFLLFASLHGKRKIIVSDLSITVPKFSFSGVKHIEVPFSEIENLELFKAGNNMLINIHHTKGKSSLAKAAFKSNAEFEGLRKVISDHMSG